MSDSKQPGRKEAAMAEVGHTSVKPGLARAIAILFLLTILSEPVIEHIVAARRYFSTDTETSDQARQD